MNKVSISARPENHHLIEKKCQEIGFTMPSDLYIGSLLKTLISSKPRSNVLELGTGIGLSLCWMVDGLDERSRLTTVDNDLKLVEIARGFFGHDPRVEIVCADGAEWLLNYTGEKFDLVFADAWPGKYSQLDKALELVKVGGFYIIDDMKAQPNWPDGHQNKVDQLIAYLTEREDFNLTSLDWSTGVIVGVKKY